MKNLDKCIEELKQILEERAELFTKRMEDTQ